LALPLDPFYQGGNSQSHIHFFQLLNVNLTYHHRDVNAEAHAQQLAARHQDQWQPLSTLKHLLAVLAISDLSVAIIY
jgi:hypothetical protein